MILVKFISKGIHGICGQVALRWIAMRVGNAAAGNAEMALWNCNAPLNTKQTG